MTYTTSPAPGARNLGQEFDGTISTRVPVGEDALVAALNEAEGWAEHGYTEESKAYWTGMRDTLRVLLGITTEAPRNGADDPAALSLLGAQRRAEKGVMP